jgi:CRISPR-associated protein Cmr3
MIPDQINLQPLNGSAAPQYNSNRNGKFIYSGRHNPCPICGRTKDQDCHWNDPVVFCHTYIDQDAGVSGYVYRGAKDIWGQYFPQETSQKLIRPKSTKSFYYPDINGQPLVKVTRTDKGDGNKSFYQSHWNGTAWVQRLNKQVKPQIHLYQIQDPINQEAITTGQPVLVVEGEGKVDLLLKMGIAATCSIGGAGSWRNYGYPNYLDDLAGANVVLCPDRDSKGLEHCEDIAADFPDAKWLYAFPNSPLWQQVPDKGGLDIADWINSDGATGIIR